MLIGYGNYEITFAITGQSGTGAAFLTDSGALNDGRTGSGASLRWTNGTQNTSDYVQITATLSSPLDTVAPQGVVGVCNVQGLPVGTKLDIAGVTQRLVAGERGELGAWALPFATGNTCVIRIYNDVNGTSPIVPAAEFFIGEIFVGRVVDLCTLIFNSPTSDLVDPTSFQRSAGGQLWQTMRKPYRTAGATLGTFSTKQAKGGTLSNLPDGAFGVTDVQTLRDRLSTAAVCAICDIPTPGLGDFTETNGIRFDKDLMQINWMLARPVNVGQITMTKPPRWTWNPTFQEAT
jgi:hypothetical protein